MHGPRHILVLAISMCVVGLALAQAGEPRSMAEWLVAIDRDYGANGWGQQHRLRPDGYMRRAEDTGWQTRMLALQAVVNTGISSIGPLIRALESGSPQQRVFAAEALGYLGSDAPLEPLLAALKTDSELSVRLHAVDSIGMRGSADSVANWEEIRSQQTNGDVRKHIGYLIERGGQGMSPESVKELKGWNPGQINTAKPDMPAPQFELGTATGGTVRLSDFRGKSVVLVFLYGDTCPVCHQYLAKLKRALHEITALDAVLLAVDSHEIWAARSLLKESGFTTDDVQYPLLLDPSHAVSATYGVAMQERIHTEISSRPATFIVDRGGMLKYEKRASTFLDRPSPDEIIAELRKLK